MRFLSLFPPPAQFGFRVQGSHCWLLFSQEASWVCFSGQESLTSAHILPRQGLLNSTAASRPPEDTHTARTRQATVTRAAGTCSQVLFRVSDPRFTPLLPGKLILPRFSSLPVLISANSPLSPPILRNQTTNYVTEPMWRLTGRFGGQGGGRGVVGARPLPLHGAPLL